MLGTMLEYMDFFMYSIVAALVFNKVFFPPGHPLLDDLGSAAIFGVAYLARPIGALFLGNLGDRIGRRRVTLYTVSVMGASTFLIGCLPSYRTIGVAAPVLLAVLRLLQGLSASAEQAGASSLTMEHAPTARRALYTSWTNVGTSAGSFLSQLFFIPVLALPRSELLAWGWRIPFLVTMVGTIAVVLLRRSVAESAAFLNARTSGVERFPLRRLIRRHWANLIRVVLCNLMAVPTSIIQVFVLSYAAGTVGISSRTMLLLGLAINSPALMIFIPLWAALADRVGRKPVFAAGVLGAGIAFFPYMYFMSRANMPMMIVFQAIFWMLMAAGQSLVLPIYTEMFETRIRFSGVAVGSQFGLVLTGFAPTISFAILQPGRTGWWPVAVFAAACCAVSAVAVLTARETKGIPVGSLDAAQENARRLEGQHGARASAD
jgi:MFS family permease